jgi:predicted enzyme related to lactoylglutathione lyase
MDHLINWTEIPASDLPRARTFYEQVLETELLPLEFGSLHYALFPTKSDHNTGALVQGPGYVPSENGPLLYLDASGKLDALLARVEAAGGKVLMPRTFLSAEAGYVGIFMDSEGNRIGLQEPVTEANTEPVADQTMQRLLANAEPSLAFLVRKGPAFDDPSLQHLQWEHARNMFTLLRDRKLRSVTALVDGSDVLGVGVFAVAREEAEQLLRDDPGVRGGRLTMQLFNAASFAAGEVRF